MELRDYQFNLISDVCNAWQAGHKNVCMQLPTGGGKTVIFSSVIDMHDGRSIVIAHRVEILYQISLTLARNNIRHNIIAQDSTVREIVKLHMQEFNKRFYDDSAECTIASVDTLIKLDAKWFDDITLVIQDEAHHVLKNNKWGKVASKFKNAKGLYPTATPVRADGKGLGVQSDGIMNYLCQGPNMRELMNLGFLTDYKIYAPPSKLDLSSVPVGVAGDYSSAKLREAVHKARLMGDIVQHYLKLAKNKLGVTFAVDVQAATDIAKEFNANGVPAAVISAKTPALDRANLMRKFRDREILQLVNVDILGEGVDVPAIEVVSFARPTKSYALYAQQFGRALRPSQGKQHAIIIDHADNVRFHGLPNAPRAWTLDRREKKARSTPGDVMPVTTCFECFAVYEAYKSSCPFCDYVSIPESTRKIEHVGGDLVLLDIDVLQPILKEIDKIADVLHMPRGLSIIAQKSLRKKHEARRLAQSELKISIANFMNENGNNAEARKKFYYTFGVDMLTAQTKTAREMSELKILVDGQVNSKLS